MLTQMNHLATIAPRWSPMRLLARVVGLLLLIGGSLVARATDVLVVGGGTSGVAAALQCARMGVPVTLVESTTWLGGMLTQAGVSAVDGNYRLPAGLWGEFRDALVQHYGSLEALQTGWVSQVMFEPHVGDSIFKVMVGHEPLITVSYQSGLTALRRDGQLWQATLTTPAGLQTLNCKIVIDATELGDVARMVGVPYDVGLEARSVTGEDMAPEQALPIVQDMTYVAILKDVGHDATIKRPEDYDAARYRCSAINDGCTQPSQPGRMWPVDKMITYGRLPGGKYMINWPIEGNDYYDNVVDATTAQREQAYERAKQVTLGFVYYLQTELGFSHLALAPDEYPTADRLPWYPYHRESRRIHGLVRFTAQHITEPFDQPQPLYRTTIAVGDYPVDQHHDRYQGSEPLPDLHFHPVPSYGLPLGTLIPAGFDNLIVAEKSISVSNVVNGTTRLQPVVMQTGTAAGAVAALAVKGHCLVAQVPVRSVQQAVLDAGGYLLPYLDVARSDSLFAPLQRLGATGIIRGEGRTEGWSNETWVHPEHEVTADELRRLYQYYGVDLPNLPQQVLGRDIERAVGTIARRQGVAHVALPQGYDEARPMSRGQFAQWVDQVLDPFGRIAVDHKGNVRR